MSNTRAASSRSTPMAARKLVMSRNTMPVIDASTPRPDARLTALEQQREALTAELAAQEAVLQQLSATATALPPMVAADRRGGIGAVRQLREHALVLKVS